MRTYLFFIELIITTIIVSSFIYLLDVNINLTFIISCSILLIAAIASLFIYRVAKANKEYKENEQARE